MTTAPPTTTTFLFTDIEGSTRLWEESSEMSDRVDRHFHLLRGAVERHGGRVFSTMGDGIAAAFGSVDAAVNAAVEAQQRLPELGLAVRMGIHTGEIAEIDDDYRGRPVNRAARVMDAGHGGQILLSDVSAALVRDLARAPELLDLGQHCLAGFDGPGRLWQIVHPELRTEFAALRTTTPVMTNLPATRSSLVGRDAESATVVQLVHAHRVVTLTGVGGVGKTRLALHAAAGSVGSFPEVWYVELAQVVDDDDVVHAVASGLGVRPIHDPLGAVAAMLGSARALLVLDNCEHVIDQAAHVVDRLTAECAGLHVLATSREPLHVDGERVLGVRPLDWSTDGIELFRQRAEAAGTDVSTLDVEVIGHVCRRLDGLPLAIELAAARTAGLGLTAVANGLDDRFHLLSSGRRRAFDRHATMRATIDWSFRLLDPSEQRLLTWLAVFPSGFELDAAVHIGGALDRAPMATVDAVESLVRRSMLTAETRPGPVRYRMLETVRAYAFDELDERSETGAALDALTAWVVDLLGVTPHNPGSPEVERTAVRLEREVDAWREAAAHVVRVGATALAPRLCRAPAGFFLLGRHDLVDIVRPLVALTGADPLERRWAMTALTVSAAGITPPEQLDAWAAEVAELDAVSPSGLAGLVGWLALAWQGRFEESIEQCLAGAADERVPGDMRDLLVAIAALDRFSLTNATDDRDGLIERCLEIAERSPVNLHRATSCLGAAWGLAGRDAERAIELARRSLVETSGIAGLPRFTMPGNFSRLVSRFDPAVAAAELLAQIEGAAGRRSFLDLIPVLYAVELLGRVGRPVPAGAEWLLEVAPRLPKLSMMQSADLARSIAATSSQVSIGELVGHVCAELAVVAAEREAVLDGCP